MFWKGPERLPRHKPGFQICLHVWFLSLLCCLFPTILFDSFKIERLLRKCFLERPKIFFYFAWTYPVYSILAVITMPLTEKAEEDTPMSEQDLGYPFGYAFRSEWCMMLTPWPFGSECSVNLTELRVLHLSLQLTK